MPCVSFHVKERGLKSLASLPGMPCDEHCECMEALALQFKKSIVFEPYTNISLTVNSVEKLVMSYHVSAF